MLKVVAERTGMKNSLNSTIMGFKQCDWRTRLGDVGGLQCWGPDCAVKIVAFHGCVLL